LGLRFEKSRGRLKDKKKEKKYIKEVTLVENDRSHLPYLLGILNMKTFSSTLVFKDRQASNLNTKKIQPR
jgi:hypothetical protein